MADDLGALSKSLDSLLATTEPIQHAMGQAGKSAALAELERDAGRDRQLSGLRRKVRLNAGYDLGTPVVLNMRPKGLIILLDSGRKRTGTIRPRRRGGRKALAIPGIGVRASAMSRPSRGRGTLGRLERRLPDEVTTAAHERVGELLAERF